MCRVAPNTYIRRVYGNFDRDLVKYLFCDIQRTHTVQANPRHVTMVTMLSVPLKAEAKNTKAHIVLTPGELQPRSVQAILFKQQ
jgi:hypothetical protein